MISILCPSRGRPQIAKRLVDTALSTSKYNIEILLYLNEDDEKLSEYLDIIDNKHITIGKDRSPVYTWNKLAEQSQGEICFLSADHVTFVKQDWDDLVYEKFNLYEDKIAFVYPSVEHLKDHNGEKFMTEWFCPFYFVHKNWINTLGYFACPVFWHWFPDLYFLNVAKKINRREIIKERIVDCLSVKTDKTDEKKNHLSNREKDIWTWTKVKLNRWVDADAKELQNFIEQWKTKS